MLTPEEPVRAGCIFSPDGELSAAVRTFGKFPNLDDWLPGDILLVSSRKPGLVQRQITSVQQCAYGQSHALWHHAAIYMGNGFVVEATTRGVRYTSVSHYVGGHILSLRRNPDLSPHERWLVAIEAGVRLKQAYGFRDILQIYRRSFPALSRQIRPSVLRQADSVICSQLCLEAHAGVTQKLIVPLRVNPVVPAALSQSTSLLDVSLYWCAIA